MFSGSRSLSVEHSVIRRHMKRLPKCKHCGEEFIRQRIGQKVCQNYNCVIGFAKANKIKAYNAETRKKKRELLENDRRHWIKRATTTCNAYIRARDAGSPCISCGRYHQGQYHAGHYRPAGNNSALRFDERNIHLQCAPCNNHQSGNLTEYRPRLIAKVGIEVVEWLEGPQPTKKWPIEELREIEAHYKEKLKALKRNDI